MRILWLAHRDMKNPKAGGAERTILEVGRRLVKDGHELTLLSGGFKGCSKVDKIDGINVVRYGRKIGIHLVVPILLIKNNYDLVINDLGHAVPWPSTFLEKGKRVVFFRHLHARSLPGQVNPILAKIITAVEKTYPIVYRDTPFITESSTSRSDLLKLSIKGENITVIPPGVDHERFRLGKKTEFPSMVYFGGMRQYKRPEVSVYLAYELSKVFPDIRLFFVGDGPGIEKLKHLATEFGIDRNLQFMGKLDDYDLADTVSASWINIHSSVVEGWGYSVLEASSAGTPTVAYDVPGISDSITNGKNGIKVKDGNLHDLLDAALMILDDPSLWSVSAHKVAEEYGWNETVRSWERLILELQNRSNFWVSENLKPIDGEHRT